MVHQISNRYIQAVMNNLKLISLDHFAAKKSGVLDWRIYFLLCLEGNALQTSYWVQHAQGNARHSFSDMFNVISYACVTQ